MVTISHILSAVGRTSRSLWTALALLLLLAALSAVGTFFPRDGGGSPFFQSDPYRLLLVLLAVHVASCLWSRRRRFRPLSLASHLLLLAVMGLALGSSLAGTVLTQNLYVGTTTDTAYSWEKDADLPLPFTVRVERLHFTLYPRSLQVGFRSITTGEKKPLIFTRVGVVFDVPGVPGRFTVRAFNPERKDILVVYQQMWRDEVVLLGGDIVPGTDLEMVLVGEREISREIQKELYAELILSRDGREVARGTTGPNRPLTVEGTDIFLTAWGKDESGKPHVGLQFVHDPLRPWTMGAGGLFALAVTGALLLRPGRPGKKPEAAR